MVERSLSVAGRGCHWTDRRMLWRAVVVVVVVVVDVVAVGAGRRKQGRYARIRGRELERGRRSSVEAGVWGRGVELGGEQPVRRRGKDRRGQLRGWQLGEVLVRRIRKKPRVWKVRSSGRTES